ncbi:MAG: acetate/propionate family kinase [Xanthobacteraceae bacterium]|nr:acetate/propionate family kinase [Xanthobacteraceae bacterium]
MPFILVLNAGSSSVKFSLFAALAGGSLRADSHGEVSGIGTRPHFAVGDADGNMLAERGLSGDGHDRAIAAIHEWLAEHGGEAGLAAVGHRIVHGGADFAEPVVIDRSVIAALEKLVPLAPLHQPHNLAAIRALSAVAPEVPQIACFDTAFHRTQTALAQQFALPRALTSKGVRRYGFHGLSYEYIVSVLAKIAPEEARHRVVVAHLGNGASLCAIADGHSVATTMSFTPVDGLMMGTRAGALDPGVILYLMQHEGMEAKAVEHLIYHEAGLLGVSGLSSDMRELLASSSPEAKKAVDLFVYRIGRELGSMAAALGGIDALVFTGGIGEHAAPVRAAVCRDAAWLGIELDGVANDKQSRRISTARSAASAWVIPTDENLMIARHTHRLLETRQPR